jgi:hypothetical protein
MRLLRIEDDGNFGLVEYVGNRIPPYAILSHTWEADYDEVTFKDLTEGTGKNKKGYGKLTYCGKRAANDGLQFFWVDTCCIDKSSSAELSEAINSMYAWYRHADICYAYLSDVHGTSQFCHSRWFERGWTLQELLAPADVLFFNSSWTEIGFKTSLTPIISQRTGIDEMALHDGSSFDTYSIAERMSWAADRQTTRVEDEAYCLMGIFNVNMPLIYGEGRKSFFRLQEELLKRSDDASIFAYVAFESGFPGPSTLRVTQPSNTVQASKHIDSDIYTEMEERQIFGTIGMFSTSPRFFRGAAKFVPHRVLAYAQEENHLGSPVRRNALTFELSGHLLKFQVPLWRVPAHELRPVQNSFPSKDESDSVILSNISNKHGLQLTLPSIQKLRKCAWAVYNSNWVIAFLDCRRRNAGAVGIILRESSKQGIYLRQHFPSIIEAESVNLFCKGGAFRVETIYVEADSLRTAQAEYPNPALLQPPSLSDFRDETIFRETNLREFGFSREYRSVGGISATKVYGSSNPDFPCIAFLAEKRESEPGSRLRFDGRGLVCTLYPGIGRYNRALASVVIPTDRGVTTSIPLNTQHKLVLRSQMQWKREGSFLHIDSLKKQCIIILSIVLTSKVTREG